VINLAIPGTVEIDLGQTLDEHGLVCLRQLLNRFDDSLTVLTRGI